MVSKVTGFAGDLDDRNFKGCSQEGFTQRANSRIASMEEVMSHYNVLPCHLYYVLLSIF